MEKRLKNYLEYIEKMTKYYEAIKADTKCQDVSEDFNDEDYPSLDFVTEDLRQQIAIFQHERHMHLIVTMTFAIMTLMSVFAAIFMACSVCAACIPLWIVPIAFLVLLIPYIRHYFILENGVQKLYGYYDRLTYIKK